MGLRDYTLADVVDSNARLHGERCAFSVGGRSLSHREFRRETGRLAAGLARVGAGHGSRVAILARNCLEYVLTYGACARLGAILVPINWRLGGSEIAHILGDAAPSVVIGDVESLSAADAWRGSLSGDVVCFALGGEVSGFRDFHELTGEDEAPEEAGPAMDDGFVLFYTAAVDGRSRGALLSHGNVLAGSQALREAWTLTAMDVNLGLLPLFHLAGMNLMLATFMAGGVSVIESTFDAAGAVKLLGDHKATILAVFSPMLDSLLTEAEHDSRKIASLRVVTGLETPTAIARLESLCPTAEFWSGYGQSETSGYVTLGRHRECPGAAGRPNQPYNVRVVDEADEELHADETGEIVVRGPGVFRGYWRRPQDNDRIFRNGWHHTGDMGHLDAAGHLWYVGRLPEKELIKSGGENVYPAEVELVLLKHPAILEAVVLGVVDPRWGEAIRAICVRRSGQGVEAGELMAFVGDRLAQFKRPRQIVFVDALPRTPAGLIDRPRLKKLYGTSADRDFSVD